MYPERWLGDVLLRSHLELQPAGLQPSIHSMVCPKLSDEIADPLQVARSCILLVPSTQREPCRLTHPRCCEANAVVSYGLGL